MAASCCGPKSDPTDSPQWRRALWIALGVNASMFAAEFAAGTLAGSHSLRADALDFLGDAANYAISLAVAGMALAWRAKAALLKGITLLVAASYVLASALLAAFGEVVPKPHVMGLMGTGALVANLLVAAMLFRFRSGDANMQSVWICSRNDAIGNVAVVAAAAGVFGTGTAWPDLVVAVILASLGFWGGTQIVLKAREELGGIGRREALQ